MSAVGGCGYDFFFSAVGEIFFFFINKGIYQIFFSTNFFHFKLLWPIDNMVEMPETTLRYDRNAMPLPPAFSSARKS